MMPLRQSSLLITGATGFIGGSMAHYFSKQSRYLPLATGRSELKGDQLRAKGISFQSADLTRNGDLDKFSIKPTYIIHAAGFAAPWGSKKEFYDHNVKATENLLAYAVRNNVERFVYISSSSIYSAMHHQFDVTEDQIPPRFVSYYGQSKYKAELCVMEAGRRGLPVIILRPRAVIGAGDTTVLPRLINAHESGRLRKIGYGETLSDITTIANLTEAVQLSLSARHSVTGNIFNITDGQPVHLWNMIEELLRQLNLPPLKDELSWLKAVMISSVSEAIAKLFNREPALPLYVVSLLGRSLTLNIDKAKNLLLYKPVQTSEQGLEDYVKSYRNQKLIGNGWS